MGNTYYRMDANKDLDPKEIAEAIEGARLFHDTVYLPESFVLSDDPLRRQMDEQALIDKHPVRESYFDDSRIHFDQITSFYVDKYDVDDSRLMQWSKNLSAWMQGKAQATKEELNSTMDSKMEVVGTAIESKLLIHDRMLGYMDDSEFAYRLASDANVRKTVNLLCQQVLQPTPVTSIPQAGNSFINLGGGISAFWNEMQKKLPIELDNVAGIENILMNINAGLDKNMEPDTRKKFLSEAGLTDEQVNEFVTAADYEEYETRAREIVRAKVMEDLGIKPGDTLSEAELMAVDAMTEERMMGAKMQVSLDNYEVSFEDVYGISAQDMYELFGDAMNPGEPPKIPDDPMDVFSEEIRTGYFDILNGSLDENMMLFEELRQQEIAKDRGLNLTEADLDFASGSMKQDAGLTAEDLAFADQYTNSINA